MLYYNITYNRPHNRFPLISTSYRKDRAVVRDVAETSGTPYNKSAYDAEAKREDDALAKKNAAPPKAP